MQKKEGNPGGFIDAVAEEQAVVPQSTLERQAKRVEALRVVHAVSSLAGNEIPILPTPDAESIPQSPGIYLLPDYDDPSNPIIDSSFEENPWLLSGRADSAHSVLTGKLSSMTKSGELKTVPVAVKCSLKRTPEERFERAISELTIMDDMYRRDELGFKPIALAVAPDYQPMNGKLIIISRFDGTINTMDNLPWGRGISDRGNVEAAVLAASAIGKFNAELGYQHNDAKIKNVATSATTSQIGLIDFETSENIDPNQPLEASTAAHVDFGLLVKSLADKGFFKHPKAQNVLELLADRYLEQWVDYPSTVFDVVHDVVIGAIQPYIQNRHLLRHPSQQYSRT